VQTDEWKSNRRSWLICLGLALAVLVVYGPLLHAGFITYDDPDYVSLNPHVQGGLTWADFTWALTTDHASNWHPLTWLSHMLDVSIYGMNPGGHHMTNVALHMANSILLFLLLQSLTKSKWPSAMVAALFALHPLHVESVAWIAERKDVLSALFWILAIWAYAAYARPATKRGLREKGFYALSMVLFALGLTAKPMLVTLPFILLLLDYWPLQRRQTPLAALLVEKTPFFLLSIASCVVTFLVQRHGGTVLSLAVMPAGPRLANVPVAYFRYVAKTLWPANLTVSYPMRLWPVWCVGGSILFLLALSGLAFWQRRAQPWLAVGWLWFLASLAPVIGFVQVGMQSMADRYTYIPGIGLFIIIVWAARMGCNRLGRGVSGTLGVCAVVVCLFLTARQAAYWQDSRALFTHAVEKTKNNFVAYDMLGDCEEIAGHTNVALAYLQTAARIQPDFATIRNRLGHIYLGVGEIDQALAQLQIAVSLDPKLADAHYNLGHALLAKGRLGEALDQFQIQVNLVPDDFKAEDNMGAVLLQNGLAEDSIPFLQKAVALNSTNDTPHYLLGNAFYRTHRAADAIRQYEESIRLNPGQIQARNDLAWILACAPDPAIRNGARAVKLAARASQLDHGLNPAILGTLAASQAEAGDFSAAIATEQRACQTAAAQTNAILSNILKQRLQSYQAGSPWRDAAPNPGKP
jgi:tetratricopeptide (TPR) repeat protein